jgi:HEPN domain-containing protein
MEPKLELVQNWLIKASRDLGSARKLAGGADPYLDVAIYLCQQAAEKAVKGLLVYHDQPFKKTHDIGALVSLATRHEPRISAWQDAATRLTPYATEFRYPGSVLQPSVDEFGQALAEAAGVYSSVLAVLPSQVHPSKVQDPPDFAS